VSSARRDLARLLHVNVSDLYSLRDAAMRQTLANAEELESGEADIYGVGT